VVAPASPTIESVCGICSSSLLALVFTCGQLFMSRPVRTQGHQLPFIHELRVQGACERQGQQGVSRVPGVRTAGIVHFPSLQQCCDKLCEAHRVCNYKHD